MQMFLRRGHSFAVVGNISCVQHIDLQFQDTCMDAHKLVSFPG